MKHGGTLIWRLNVPIDFYEPWNFEAATTFIKILQRNQQYCKRMVQSDAFIKLHSERKFDLVVVDHIVQVNLFINYDLCIDLRGNFGFNACSFKKLLSLIGSRVSGRNYHKSGSMSF